MKRIINVAEIAKPNWKFIEKIYPNTNVEWLHYSANPNNIIEKLVSRPKISRYRACLQGTLKIRNPNDIVISHMPRITNWQSFFMKKTGRNVPHLAFSFNFTELPGKVLRSAMIKNFRRVSGFVVYTNFEKKLYSDYFEIPIERIHMLHWAMDTPAIDENFNPSDDNYYCAVGGEGRDYKTLIEAFEKLKNINLIIVTRPNALNNINIPNNVKVFYNLQPSKFWSVVQKSEAVIVQLQNNKTPCGHITLVGAMKLRKPIICSFSHGITDYTIDINKRLITRPKDSLSLINAIHTLESNPSLIEEECRSNYEFSKKHCNLHAWSKFVYDFVENRNSS